MRLCPSPCLSCCFRCRCPPLPMTALAGFAATGLTFGQTDAVAMEEEDLFIGIDKDRGRLCVPQHSPTSDVTGEVIFPLPPDLRLGGMMNSMMNLPEDLTQDDLVGFHRHRRRQAGRGADRPHRRGRAAVGGRPPAAAQYDTPGRDVTADLERLGHPADRWTPRRVREVLLALPPEQQAEVDGAGLAEFYDGDPAQSVTPDVWCPVVDRDPLSLDADLPGRGRR